MTQEIAFAAVNLSMSNAKTSGLLFYGGEPLLERQLIYDTVNYANSIKEKTGHNFYYKITTNGTLLDEEFLKFSKEHNLTIGFSHDGPMQDKCRLFNDGSGTAALLEEKISLLLEYQPYALAMSVMDPSTVHNGAEIVKFLFDKGFRYIHISVNYCKTAGWTEERLKVLEQEYKKMAQMYIDWTGQEQKFYLSPFDMKILSHIKGEKYNSDRLLMMQNQPSVGSDGKIYYSSKYLDDVDFELGDVFSGINVDKQKLIYEKSLTPAEPCKKCAIRTRCNYAYDSLISGKNGISTEILPMQCANEQILTPIVDHAAETLYKEGNALFMHKHYNEMYPVISLLEDRI